MVKMKGFKTFVACTVAAITIMSATSTIMAATTGKVTADVLNLRSGKSLASSVILKIPQNSAVSILDSSDASWLKINYNGKIGYVSKQFVKTATASAPGSTASTGTGIANADNLNVRQEGNKNSTVVAKLKKNAAVNVVSKSGDWYYITSGTVKGYVSAEFITIKTLTGKINAPALNVRSEATLSSAKAGIVIQDAKVEVMSASGDWYYIQSGSTKGYIFSRFVTLSNIADIKSISSDTKNTVSPNQTNTPKSTEKSKAANNTLVKGNIFKCTVVSLNVRKSPSTSAARIGSLVKGNQVTFVAVASDKNWYEIITSKGITGYVHNDYVTYYSTGDVSRGNSPSVSNNNPTVGNSGAEVSNVNASKEDKIIDTAKAYLGTRYVYGGASPNGFDCSGFVQYVMKLNQVSIQRSSVSQARQGMSVQKADLRKGDLVFFSSSTGSSKIGHVGIYMGGGEFIHSASGSKMKVIISSLSQPFYQETYITARRVF